MTYSRDGDETDTELTRTAIEMPSVESDLKNDLYYIRVRLLCDTTAAQFESAVKEAIMTDDIKGIIIDIRDLSDGYSLEPVANMLDVLMPTGTLITGTYSGGVNKVLYTSNESSVSLPIAVLVNAKTTGYAEMFAAVMSDSKNCVIVGETTAGKGTLKQLFSLNDGSGIEVTVAVLNAPVSGAYNGIGVVPDYVVSVPEGFVREDIPSESLDAQFSKAAEAIRAVK